MSNIDLFNRYPDIESGSTYAKSIVLDTSIYDDLESLLHDTDIISFPIEMCLATKNIVFSTRENYNTTPFTDIYCKTDYRRARCIISYYEHKDDYIHLYIKYVHLYMKNIDSMLPSRCIVQ